MNGVLVFIFISNFRMKFEMNCCSRKGFKSLIFECLCCRKYNRVFINKMKKDKGMSIEKLQEASKFNINRFYG